MTKVPVIDIFAGPGGLSEGFSRYSAFTGDDIDYKVMLSVEKDEVAHRTLTMRSFVRQFPEGELPEEYYSFLRCEDAEQGNKFQAVLEEMPEWAAATNEALLLELGPKNFKMLHAEIDQKLKGRKDWVLLGGPPCQAYSKIGRSRLTGLGQAAFQDADRTVPSDNAHSLKVDRLQEFLGDHRHTLYREYLKIVAFHRPAVFVMENVPGILSSRMPLALKQNDNNNGRIFDRILADLKDPVTALKGDPVRNRLTKSTDGTSGKYSLYPFSEKCDQPGFQNENFLINCERHGIPQARKRVVILGIREDIDVVPDPILALDTRVTISSVIGGLPSVRSGRSRGKDSSEEWVRAINEQVPDELLNGIGDGQIRERMRNARDNLKGHLGRGGRFVRCEDSALTMNTELARWINDPQIEGVCQHETRTHMDSDFLRYLFVSVYGDVYGRSPKLRHFPDAVMPDHRSAAGQQLPGSKDKVFADRFRVQVADQPSTTVMSHIRKDGHYYIHYDPTQCRSLTVREAARLQTFPDNYFFAGNRTQQYQQVGNAVPSYLAVQLAGVVAGVLEQAGLASDGKDKNAA